jgi:hypothetical protein
MRQQDARVLEAMAARCMEIGYRPNCTVQVADGGDSGDCHLHCILPSYHVSSAIPQETNHYDSEAGFWSGATKQLIEVAEVPELRKLWGMPLRSVEEKIIEQLRRLRGE